MNLENFDWGIMNDYELKNSLHKEIFENKIYTQIVDVKEGDVVVDIGASVGPFTYSILDKKPSKVFSFEPSKSEFTSLVKNTFNGPVVPINKAIWDSNGLIEAPSSIYYEKTYVETIKFSTFRNLYGIDHINFLKTDCEGGEYYIFNDENIDFLLSSVDFIVGEWHLETLERKNLFRDFRDKYVHLFKNVETFSIDGVNIKWDFWNEHYIEYYKQVIIHLDNRKNS